MNPNLLSSVARLARHELLARVKHLAAHERETTASLIAHLAEFDRRRLYLAEGCSSLFTYCTLVLHLSEHAAYRRIEAARAARRLPVILERLVEGSVNLTTVGLLTAHLTPGNHMDLLDAARYVRRRQVEELRCRAHNQYEAELYFGPRDVPAVRETRAPYMGDLVWGPTVGAQQAGLRSGKRVNCGEPVAPRAPA